MQYSTPPQTKPMMTFQDAIRQCLRKYADFSGRATRAEYWWWVLATVIASIAFSAIDSSIVSFAGGYDDGYAFSPLGTIFGLAILLPDLAVTARRLHDIGKTGWWQLVWFVVFIIGLIPFIIGLIALLVAIMDGGWFSYAAMEEMGYSIGVDFSFFVPLIVGGLITLVVSLAIFLWALIWLARQGQTGPNRFGLDPRALDEPVPPATDAIE